MEKNRKAALEQLTRAALHAMFLTPRAELSPRNPDRERRPEGRSVRCSVCDRASGTLIGRGPKGPKRTYVHRECAGRAA